MIPTAEEVGQALANLGNWRVLHVQEACCPYVPIPASTMLALGFRETGLRNICGGAKWQNERWVATDTDRGWLQISAEIDPCARWLEKQEGCPNGSWVPVDDSKAIKSGHVPRFSPALDFTKATMLDNMRYARNNGVPQRDLLRFAIAAHNAGAAGAFNGWRAGDVDKYTAHGDYSKSVLEIAPLIHAWIAEHPGWQFHP